MANTYTSLHYHVVFSTRNREPWIRPDIESRLWEYLGGIARANGMLSHRVGGIENHVHLLISIPQTMSVSEAVKLIKGGSSGWVKENLSGCRGFAWQDGYGAFTVSKSVMAQVEEYIIQQREHHRVKSFEEEYLAFLKRHEVEFDERYVWG